MRFSLYIALICFTVGWMQRAAATTISDPSLLVGATVVRDWEQIGAQDGEAGPVVYQTLTIQSFANRYGYLEIQSCGMSEEAGFEAAGASGVNVLRANIERTSFLFTFPTEVESAGFFIRDIGSFGILALDAEGFMLDWKLLELPWSDPLAFVGFTELDGLHAIRVEEYHDNGFVTDFDDVQWVATPEPNSLSLFLLSIGAAFCYASTRGMRA
jgi:hypothetical protein